MKNQFGLGRLLAATIAFAVPFALLDLNGKPGVVIASVVSICLGLIVLLTKRGQIWPLVQIVIFGILGIMFGFALGPTVHPPNSSKFGYMIGGCLIGCIVGIALRPEKSDPLEVGANE